VVLEKNLFNIPALEIHTVRVDYTVAEGKLVYERK
jgi:predicted amidohydrolase YtcJ